MALDTYAHFESYIADHLARTDLTTQIVDFITLFEAWANRNIRVRQQEANATITMTSGAGTLPTDYLSWRRVKWPGSTARELEYADPNWITETYPDSPSDTPAFFTIVGSTISVMPVDSTSLSFDYYQKIAALSGTVNWLFSAHPDLYVAGTLFEAYSFLKDPVAVAWMQKRDGLLEEIKNLHNRSRMPASIKPQGVYTP